MKVQFPITMSHDLAVRYKDECRAAGMSFSEVVRFALEEIAPIDLDLIAYMNNKKSGFFKGTLLEYREKHGKCRRLNEGVEISTQPEL